MIKLFAHRGSPVKEAENTIVSFKRAIREKADWIEFDVRKGKKKHLFVIHDDNLQRTTGQDVSLKHVNFTTVRNVRVGSKGERIPLLEEVLLLAKDTDIMLNIELKEKHLEREIVDMIEHYEMSPQIIISSFFYLPLLVLADYRPKFKTALLIDEPPEDLKARLIETEVNYIHPNIDGVVKTLHLVRCYNVYIITTYLMYAEIIENLHASNMKLFTYPSKYQVFTSLSNIDFLNDETVKIARLLRKKINPFTVNTKKDLKKALQYKINGIFTNRVLYMRKMMKELDIGE